MNDNHDLPSNLWFTARWMTGYLLDLIITVGACTAMFWTFKFYSAHPIQGTILPDWLTTHSLTAFGVGLGVFSAFMAGRQWVRTQYFTHVLPEVWQDAVQNFIRSAKKDENDR